MAKYDEFVLMYFRNFPDSTLGQVAHALYTRYPREFDRTSMPEHTARVHAQNSINSLIKYGHLEITAKYPKTYRVK